MRDAAHLIWGSPYQSQDAWRVRTTPYTLRPAPTPYALHPTPYTLHPTRTLHPTPYTLHPAIFFITPEHSMDYEGLGGAEFRGTT